jgi:inactivated superfamily I helicase
MTTFVIWGEDDHSTRAKSLATAYATTAASIKDAPRTIGGLDKLVFWGHGDTHAFCTKKAEDFVALVGEWRKKNPGLTTVEMLTCNARHKQTNTDSYTDQVVTALSRKQARRADMVNFRALPVAVTKSGKTCDWSILKWHPQSATWAYVGAPTKPVLNHWDNDMHDAVVMLENFKKPRGTGEGYRDAFAAFSALKALTLNHPYAIKYKFTQEKVDEFNKKLNEVKNDAYIVAGTLGLLRWLLVDIK